MLAKGGKDDVTRAVGDHRLSAETRCGRDIDRQPNNLNDGIQVAHDHQGGERIQRTRLRTFGCRLCGQVRAYEPRRKQTTVDQRQLPRREYQVARDHRWHVSAGRCWRRGQDQPGVPQSVRYARQRVSA